MKDDDVYRLISELIEKQTKNEEKINRNNHAINNMGKFFDRHDETTHTHHENIAPKRSQEALVKEFEKLADEIGFDEAVTETNKKLGLRSTIENVKPDWLGRILKTKNLI